MLIVWFRYSALAYFLRSTVYLSYYFILCFLYPTPCIQLCFLRQNFFCLLHGSCKALTNVGTFWNVCWLVNWIIYRFALVWEFVSKSIGKAMTWQSDKIYYLTEYLTGDFMKIVPRFRLRVSQHWFIWCLGTEQVTSDYLNTHTHTKYDPVKSCQHASADFHELTKVELGLRYASGTLDSSNDLDAIGESNLPVGSMFQLFCPIDSIDWM